VCPHDLPCPDLSRQKWDCKGTRTKKIGYAIRTEFGKSLARSEGYNSTPRLPSTVARLQRRKRKERRHQVQHQLFCRVHGLGFILIHGVRLLQEAMHPLYVVNCDYLPLFNRAQRSGKRSIASATANRLEASPKCRLGSEAYTTGGRRDVLYSPQKRTFVSARDTSA